MDSKIYLLNTDLNSKSVLDRAYLKLIRDIRKTIDDEGVGRWEIYNMVINELINNGKTHYLPEMKYRLTDGESPNDILIDFINKEKDNVSGLIWFLKKRIEEFKEDDFFNQFYK